MLFRELQVAAQITEMQLLIFTIVVRVGVLLFVELGEKGAIIVATGLILRFVDIVVILVVDAA